MNVAIATNNEHLENLLRHIDNVRDSCTLLGKRLIKQGEPEVGKGLIANGFSHDNSKFHGIEWLYLREEMKEKEPENFKLALMQHWSSNFHHPEYWHEGVNEMPRLFLAEFVCDIHARASEFGSDLREWVKNKAVKKYKMNHHGRVYKEVRELLDLLLEKEFK